MVDLVLAWLKLVLNIEATHDHQWLHFKLTVLQLNTLLQANYRVYRHPTAGVTNIRTLSYSIPSALSQAIGVVLPSTSFDGDQPHGSISTSPTPALVKRIDDQKTCAQKVTPSCLQNLYGIPTEKAHQSANVLAVAGFMNSYANREDLDWFLTNFRIDFQKPLPTFTDKLIDGGQNLQDPPAKHGVEANLDIQYTVGIATGVPIEFVSSGDSSVKGVVKMVNALLSETTVPTVLSFSYAFDEDFVTPRDAESLCDLFMQLGSRGTSVIIASGDGGVAGRSPKETCSTKFIPTFPASCPYVTAVGATKGEPEVGAEFSAGGFPTSLADPAIRIVP